MDAMFDAPTTVAPVEPQTADALKTEMITTLAKIEDGAQQLATAFTSFMTLYAQFAREAYPDEQRQLLLAVAIGDALPGLVVQRLRRLGCAPLLVHARPLHTTLEATWVDQLASTIERL